MPLGAEASSMAQASAQTATLLATTAPQAAAELPKTNPWLQRQQKTLEHAEKKLMKVWKVVQRKTMQLQTHLDGKRRIEELQLQPFMNKHGVVIGHLDPEPDLDSLHIKV